MKKDKITLNERVFDVYTLDTKTGQEIQNIGLSRCNKYHYYESIYQAYGRPSETKVYIWESWKRWFEGVNGHNKDMWICSKNCNFFSIAFTYSHNGITVIGHITASKQRMVIV